MIKGYLPLRIRLPSSSSSSQQSPGDNSTFLFVKEHQTHQAPAAASGDNNNNNQAQPSSTPPPTLFVTNVLAVPGVRTELLLQSIFGRFGEVRRVTVVPNPRRQQQRSSTTTTNNNSLTGSFLPLQCSSDHTVSAKFAHVVFDTPKELKRCLKRLSQCMNEKNDDSSLPPAIALDSIELQTLADESDRQWKEQRRKRQQGGEHDDDDGNNKEENETSAKSGLAAIVARYQSSLQSSRQARTTLMEECNRVMQEWEDAEREAQQAKLAASQQPDDDGFVTVSYGGNSGRVDESLVAAGGTNHTSLKRRAKSSSRSRSNKKKKPKKLGLDDFYRFQTKENRKKTLHGLRERFEEDLKKVKQLKEDKQYRPF